MRRLARQIFFVAALSFGGIATAAFAQEGVPGTGSIANEGHPPVGESTECTAASTDEQCFEFWERHINWWSWDYKAPYADPSHRHMPPPFGFAIINFAVFAFILYRLAARPLADFVRTRHTTVRQDLDEAAKLHAEAESRLREYEAKIGGLETEIATLLASVRQEAEQEKARIIAAAEAQAKHLQAEAQAQIEREVQRVRRELKAETAVAAVALAEKILQQKATEADQVKIAERFVAELERPAAPVAAAPVAAASSRSS